ncbi:MAG TPA: YkgJ family cysteine cluster protein [Polyangiales bacterium]
MNDGEASATIPDCLSCGACCFSRLETYARVTGDDHARLGPNADPLTVFIGNRCYMRIEHGHCAALDLSPGRYACRVYEQRPAVCRELERGSASCAAERERKIPRVRLSLIED